MTKMILIFVAFFCFHKVSAQYNDSISIQNTEVLNQFFEKLNHLEKNKSTVLNIVHIGDSHIQADMMTEQIRTSLNHKFGNAGRGFIFPYSLAGTNGTDLIKFESDIKWNSQRMVFENLGYPTGLSGIALFTDSTEFHLTLKIENEKYKFNRIKILNPKNELLFKIKLNHQIHELIKEENSEFFSYNSEYLLDEMQIIPKPDFTQYALNGIVLENGQPGIIYHSIGVNGAKFLDYNKYPLFFEQLKELNPDLILISLGTNEAFDKANFTSADFLNQMNEFLENLKKQKIQSPMLFTTPPPALVNKKNKNPKVEEFGLELMQKSTEFNFAIWDMFQAMGGYGNSNYLIQNLIWANDRVHFSEKGYKQQGDLFFEGLMKAYQNYKIRFPQNP